MCGSAHRDEGTYSTKKKILSHHTHYITLFQDFQAFFKNFRFKFINNLFIFYLYSVHICTL